MDLSKFHLTEVVACPWDRTNLRPYNGGFICEDGHEFAVENDIPILTDAVRREAVPANMAPCPHDLEDASVDAFVNDWIVNTNGNLYWRARGRLPRYPIPSWPFWKGDGKILVDVGCGWGRWSIASAGAGFRPIGLDVHIDALSAAQRVSKQLGVQANYLCSSVDRMPFRSASVDVVFSYSVLQHLDRQTVARFFKESFRVLKVGGRCLVQLPNASGLYNILLQARRGFRDGSPGTFEMRYWSISSIRDAVEKAGFHDLAIRTDGFFSQNPQMSDLDLLSLVGKLIVLVSLAARNTARVIPTLTRFADSLWIECRVVPPAAKLG